jgi:agmatine/peptidylarginine deiminase
VRGLIKTSEYFDITHHQATSNIYVRRILYFVYYFLDCILLLSNFNKEEIMQSKDECVASRSDTEKTLIVLSAPSVKNTYYKEKFNDIIEYMTNFANLVNGKDEVIILADTDTLPYFKGKVPANILIDASVEDIWIRDFSSVIPSRQVKFKYLPYYNKSWDCKCVDKSFNDWCKNTGVEYYIKSDLILDGGNVADNAAGTRAIVTDRFLWDNPKLTMESAKTKLKELLGVKEVAIIPEPPGDTTGHADGLATWPTDDKIILIETVEPTHTQILKELKSSFPGVEIVEIPDYTPSGTWKHFISARNCFVNCILTDDYIYMSMFNDPHDDEMLKLMQSHTNKTVVPVLADKVAMMGGSVRCLSWQVKGPNKEKILKSLKQ